MKKDPKKLLEETLWEMLLICNRLAQNPPSTPAAPNEEVERKVDAWVRGVIREQTFGAPTPEMARAALPRVQFARLTQSVVQPRFEQLRAVAEDGAATEVALLELLLIENWHKVGKARWFSGELKLFS